MRKYPEKHHSGLIQFNSLLQTNILTWMRRTSLISDFVDNIKEKRTNLLLQLVFIRMQMLVKLHHQDSSRKYMESEHVKKYTGDFPFITVQYIVKFKLIVCF